MAAPDTSISDVPVLTLRQQIFNDVATAVGSFFDIDYSLGEVIGKTVVEVLAGGRPLIKNIVYGVSAGISSLQTVDAYLPDAPIFGDPNAAPYGTTDEEILTGQVFVAPKLSEKHLHDAATGTEQQRRIARLGRNIQTVKSRVAHRRMIKRLLVENRGVLPMAVKAAPAALVTPVAPQVDARSSAVPTSAVFPIQGAPNITISVPDWAPVYQPTPVVISDYRKPDLMNIAMQRMRL